MQISFYLSIKCPMITWPLPQAPEIWVPSDDHAKEKMLPVFGFSNVYDHYKIKSTSIQTSNVYK